MLPLRGLRLLGTTFNSGTFGPLGTVTPATEHRGVPDATVADSELEAHGPSVAQLQGEITA